MALKKEKYSLIFDRGVDTKTNPKITEGYLNLTNCHVNNVELVKSQGMQKLLTAPNTDPTFTKNVFSTENQLAIAANDQIYQYESEENVLIPRGPFPVLTRTKALESSQNIMPLFYAEYGDFGALVYSSTITSLFIGGTPVTTYSLRTQNTNIDISLNEFVIGTGYTATETPAAVVCVFNGAFVYTYDSAGTGSINEYFYLYDVASLSFSNIGIIIGVQAVSFETDVVMHYPDFKIISTEFDGKFVWIFYVDNIGDAHALIRTQYGTVEGGITLSPTVVTPYTREITATATMPPLCQAQAASLNSFYWSKTPVVTPLRTYAGAVIFAQFNGTLMIFDCNTQSTPVDFWNLPVNTNYYCQSICYLSSNQSVYVLKEDLNEYMNVTTYLDTAAPYTPIAVYPYTIAYSLPLSLWTITDGVVGAGQVMYSQPPNWTTLDYTFGTAFVIGPLWPTGNTMYFCVMSCMWNGNIGGVIPMISTAPTQRHGDCFIINNDYNLVDYPLHYLGTHTEFTDSLGNIRSVPYAIIETKEALANVNGTVIMSGEHAYAFVENTQVEISGNNITFDIKTLIYDVFQQDTNKLVAYDRGNTGYFGISNMFMLTQSNAEYAQFLDYPTCVLMFTAGSTTSPSFWAYAITFEYVNPNGDLFRSAPSVFQSENIMPVTPLPTDPQPTTVVVHFTPPEALETKATIVIKIWRTTVNATTFYLLSSATFVADTTPLEYTDNATDASITGNEIAYFNGGVLAEIPFDAFYTFTLHENRIYAVTLENRNIIEYSLPFQPTVGLATTFGFQILVEPRGGPVIEIASMDDKLIIFKLDYIYYVTGDGPDALGNNSSFIGPELINSPVGCIQKSSVVRTPLGIMFQSAKGIYLLDRQLVVNYIGAPVEAYNDLTITSATLFTVENKVRFTTTQNIIIIYDFYYNTWSVDAGLTLVSTATYQGQFYGVDNNNNLLQIYDGYYKNNNPYTMTVETPWFKFAGGLQGYQRVYRVLLLGDFEDTSVLSFGICYDFVDQVQDWLYYRKDVSNTYGTGSWGSLNPLGGIEKSTYQIWFNLPRQKCEAIRFVITDGFDNVSTDTGNSFTITEIAVVYALKSETMRLPIPRRV